MKKLALKKTLTMYPYQEPIVADIVSKFGNNKPYVLGSCPGSGKTEMAIKALIRLIEEKGVDRVLILAHSTNVLKVNFYNRILTYFNEKDVAIMQGQPAYNYNARIQVMIPQNIKHVQGNFDLIVVDEAHHNVLVDGGNYAQILADTNSKCQILLTGTPSKFVYENNVAEATGKAEPYYINTIGMDVVGKEYFHDVKFDLIKSAYNFSTKNYNQSHDLLSDVDFAYEDTRSTIMNVLVGVIRNIAARRNNELPKDADFVAAGKELISTGKFGKTLIMCKNITQAGQVASILGEALAIDVKVSESKNDSDSLNLMEFKAGKFDFLCVVNRAREGYDDKKVVNLIDITMTHNIDLIYQMFCRVVRLDPTYKQEKLYIKVTPCFKGMPEYTMNILTASLMLGATKNLAKFNGKNFNAIEMPKINMEAPKEASEDDDIFVSGEVSVSTKDDAVKRQVKLNEALALDLITIFADDNANLINGNDRYAMTTLKESLRLLRDVVYCKDKVVYFKLLQEEGITSSVAWVTVYKELSVRDNINYLHSLARVCELSEAAFFAECYSKQLMCKDKLNYFKIIRKENLTSSRTWMDVYKELGDKYAMPLHSAPWLLFTQTPVSFFAECYPETLQMCKNKSLYFKVLREMGIKGVGAWSKRYRELGVRDNLKYSSDPPVLFQQSAKEFFNECYPSRCVNHDKAMYCKVMRAEAITNSGEWFRRYKALGLRDNTRYLKQPWDIGKQSVVEFFRECNPTTTRPGIGISKLQYFEAIKRTAVTSSKGWVQRYKELRLQDKRVYHSQPWRISKQSAKEFFEEYRTWCTTTNNN